MSPRFSRRPFELQREETSMIGIRRRLVLALALAAGSFGAFAQNKVNLGVSIPTATHGFTGGIVWWANEAKKELEKAHPDLKVIVKTAGTAPEQANQLQ